MAADLLYRLIQKHDTITIFGHVFPDGDCYGSQIGLKEAIKTTFPDKRVYALGSGYPVFHAKIGGMDAVDEATIAASLALVLDVADSPRVEDQRYAKARHVFKIDHHVPATDFGDDCWIDTTKNAVSEMVAGFVYDHDLKITARGASALALGMITDTGRFSFGKLEAATFHTMGRLVASGADLPMIYDILYERTFASMAFIAYVYDHYEMTSNGVLYCRFSKETLADLGHAAVEASHHVNLLAYVRGYSIWAFFAETDGGVLAELRSSGPDVQAIAHKYGGGGHVQASGARLKDAGQIDALLNDLDALLKERH